MSKIIGREISVDLVKNCEKCSMGLAFNITVSGTYDASDLIRKASKAAEAIFSTSSVLCESCDARFSATESTESDAHAEHIDVGSLFE